MPSDPVLHTPGPAELDLIALHGLGLCTGPLHLSVPQQTAERVTLGGGLLRLVDEEGAPVADLTGVSTSIAASALVAPQAAPERNGWLTVAGALRSVAAPTSGPAAAAWRTPAQLHAEQVGCTVVAVVDRPLLRADASRLPERSGLLLVTVGHDATRLLAPHALWRAVTAWSDEFAPRWRVLPVPVPALPTATAQQRRQLRIQVARRYGAERVVDLCAPDPGVDRQLDRLRRLLDQPPRPSTGDGRPEVADPGHRALARLTGTATAAVLRQARPPRGRRGVVLFFTGLSGSGKSTIARGVGDALLAHGGRTVTMLDGDVVRRMLSAGLGFSRTDRELNLRRIGWVAAEVARHGGVAVCAPIAPYAASRAAARQMAAESGADFLLVWVSTPLATCEQRDRKGLYAQARAGQVAEFTGISSPYEPPDDADLVLDTTTMPVADAVDRVWSLLHRHGTVDTSTCGHAADRTTPSAEQPPRCDGSAN